MMGSMNNVTNDICSVMSIPVSLGQPFLGADTSPQMLKDNGLLQQLSNLGWRVHQTQDIGTQGMNGGSYEKEAFMGNAKHCPEIGNACRDISVAVQKEAESGNFVLILGGDHCIPIGTIPGILGARPNTGVVWVDAHADINTPKDSGSGNMHGMPVAFLMGLVEKAHEYPEMNWFKGSEKPYLKPEDLVYIGLRDLDPPEKAAIKRLGIRAYTMHDVDRLGIGRVMQETEEYFADKEHLHCSYDIDALDPMFAPHTGTAVRGGLTFREGNYIVEHLAATGKLSSMELVEVNPSLHPGLDSKDTLDMAQMLITSAMGDRIL